MTNENEHPSHVFLKTWSEWVEARLDRIDSEQKYIKESTAKVFEHLQHPVGSEARSQSLTRWILWCQEQEKVLVMKANRVQLLSMRLQNSY